MRFSRGFKQRNEEDPLSGYYIDGSQLKFVHTHRNLSVPVDYHLKFHLHIKQVVWKAAGLACSLLQSTVCRSFYFMLMLFVMHVRLILDYCSCVWNTGYVGDLKLLETVQRCWMKNIERLTEVDCAAQLKQLELFSVKGRLLRADLSIGKLFTANVEM